MLWNIIRMIIRTRTPLRPALGLVTLLPCCMCSSVVSDHLGFSPDRSIQPSTVVRLRPAKEAMSLCFKSFTMAVVLHLGPPDLFHASSICLKRKGVNQL